MEEEKSMGSMAPKQYSPGSSKSLQYTKSFPFSYIIIYILMKFGMNIVLIISSILHPAVVLDAVLNVKTDRSHFTTGTCSWKTLQIEHKIPIYKNVFLGG
jgi:hypothetical protein